MVGLLLLQQLYWFYVLEFPPALVQQLSCCNSGVKETLQ